MVLSNSLFLSIFCFVALLVGSLMPSSIKAAMHITNNHHLLHPAIHIACFALFAFFIATLGKSFPKRLLSLFASVSFGIILELLEVVAHHQPLEFSDMRSDAIGSIIGFIACLCAQRVANSTQFEKTNPIEVRFAKQQNGSHPGSPSPIAQSITKL